MTKIAKITILTLSILSLLLGSQALANLGSNSDNFALEIQDNFEENESCKSENAELENLELFHETINNINILHLSLNLKSKNDNSKLKDLLFLEASPPDFS